MSEKITYQYQLINGTDTLTSMTDNRQVDFFSLNPGHYKFTVSAINTSGVRSNAPATLSFIIQPAWWQTWWFRLLVLGAIAVSAFAFYKFRVTKIAEQFTLERKQASLQLTAMRAQMNPHFIFNVMSSIRHYMQNNDTESADKYLTKFAKLIRYTLDNSDVQEVTLEEELQASHNYVMLEMQRIEPGLDFEIVCDAAIEKNEIMLPSLLLQPFIENAIKHGIERLSTKGKITIEIKKINDSILIAIEDNGVGRAKSSD